MIKKILIVCWLLVIGSWVFAKPALGKDFSSFYKTTYEFQGSGQALVTQEVSLINQRTDLYVSEYSLSLVGSEITNVEAYDKVGQIKTNLMTKEKTTIISLFFNEQAVGKGNTLTFILKYKASGLAKKEGNLWQISLPKLTNAGEIDEYHLILKIPSGLGKISFMNPTPVKEESIASFSVLEFDKDSLTKYGVLITTGKYQVFDFQISYNLENVNEEKSLATIAFPPDTDFQRIFYSSVDPEPQDLTVDEDGNWLASFILYPQEKLTIVARGQVKIFADSQNLAGKEKNDLAMYLRPQKYWQSDDPEIKKLAQELKTAEKIYDYVVSHLSYDYQLVTQNITRKGAVEALKNPKKVICTEFTDLFVALCRAAGIPAKELEGFAYTDNPRLNEIEKTYDVLHSWPQYYDQEKKSWIMVDPTWSNTTGGLDFFHKLDLAHFVFVTHGIDDEQPLSAGSYKATGIQEKQILISLSNQDIFPKGTSLSLVKISPEKVFSFKKNLFAADFKNIGGVSLYNQNLKQNLLETQPNVWDIELLPPFAHLQVSFWANFAEKLRDYQATVTFSIGTNSFSASISVISLWLRLFLIAGVLLSIVIGYILWQVRKLQKKKEELKLI